MEFIADPDLPEEELQRIGEYLGEILASELKLPPSEVRVEVRMEEAENDPETIEIFYIISVKGKQPNDLEMYQAHRLFESLMGYEETMLN